MANIKGVKKRVEISEKRNIANTAIKGAMKTAIKKVVKNVETADSSDAVKKIDKALKKGILHKNTAARRKALVAKTFNKAQA